MPKKQRHFCDRFLVPMVTKTPYFSDNLPNEGLVLLKKQCYKMCKDKTASLPVQTSASLSLIRIGGGNKIISYWADSISGRLESILGNNIADPSAITPVSMP